MTGDEDQTVVMDRDQLRWLLYMCDTGEGLDDTPRIRDTTRPPPEEMRHSIVSSLPPLVLEDFPGVRDE